MLLQFTVENFKSFEGPASFSMRATRDKDHPNHVLRSGKSSAVKVAAVYGANASGKSNLVLAMLFAQELILEGRRAGQSIPVEPFALGEKAEAPSGFHWTFVHAGRIWSYGFDVTGSAVVDEYLFSRSQDGGKEVRWFKRSTGTNGKVKVQFGEPLLVATEESDPGLLGYLKKSLRAEQPLLTHAIENKIEALQPVWEWFSSVLTIVRAESTFGHLIPATYGQKDFLKFIGDFLRFADTGIESLQADSEPFRRELLLAKGLDSDELAKAEQRLQSLGPGSGLLITHGWVPMGIIRDEAKKLWLLHLKARHIKADGGTVDFPLEWESEGTQRLIHLLPTLFQMKTGPTVLVVDELDRRLHTLLTRKFIELAVNDPADEMRQLVFTTHDTNLLDSWLLRRDEIWFAQKNSGVTQLTSLAEYKIRSDLDYEKAYLLGRFEGKPYFHYSPDDGGPHANGVELEAVA